MGRRKILIVMAAGSGTRMGASVPKQFLPLGGEMILKRTIEIFLSAVPDIRIITVLPKDHMEFWKNSCLEGSFYYPQTLVSGGITRFHSVKNALRKVPDGAVVAIHDGVRPLISKELIMNMFAQMDSGKCHALIPVLPAIDTLRLLEEKAGKLCDTGLQVNRSQVFRCQTPQMFLSEDIKAAYSLPFDTSFTDDASVAYANKVPLSYCDGERLNFKITSPEDLALAEMIISSRQR
ncbi:MAG: 2-C-methyl-D-erythritol 4-phosphate cytidylyltransferase [Bacteroidales bacterium]|nr:2-C-methyl-D-erythritol 4-phosphate cytidylyltransferase [Bacteroidales bacterium]MCI2133364.1 2-C-methyl-D-erythritol 4-phosphate cytidylyltransferase [Bacteroidales bacterium]